MKYNFINPFKEALDIQGKRWTLVTCIAIILEALLGIVALIGGIVVLGVGAIVVSVVAATYFICYYGLDPVFVDEEEYEE